MAKYRGKLQDADGNELYPQADGYYPGDTISDSQGTIVCGYTTSGASICLFTIPLSKPVYASSVSISNIYLEARTTSGYLYDGTTAYGGSGVVSLPSSRITYIRPTVSGIRCTWTAATRFNISSGGNQYNNAPVPLLINYTLTFS